MVIKVLVNGAKGKMGQQVCQAVQADAELSLVARSDLGDDLAAALASSGAEAVVDFTHPKSRMEIVQTVLSHKAYAVIGTTGFTERDLSVIATLCQEQGQGCLIAPNFSIGAVLMMQFAAAAARFFPDVEIIEYHHKAKADCPSGTAMRTAQIIAEAQKMSVHAPSKDPTEIWNLPGSRGGELAGIRIHGVRLPGFVASQEVLFGSNGEILKIRQDTSSREAFMPGVIMAIKKMQGRKELVYGLDKLLQL
jgi:4-hydroxy-tetrahydrodipicolinate reductase